MARIARSLLGRIVIANLATMVAAAALVPLASATLLNGLSTDYHKLALEARINGIAEALRDSATLNLTGVPDGRIGAVYGNAFSGQLFAVLTADGRVLIDKGEAPAVLAMAATSGDGQLFRTGDIYSLASRLQVRGRLVRIIASLDIRSPGAITDDVVAAFVSRFLLLLAPILLALTLLNIWLVRRMTAAIRSEADVARTIGPAAPDRRIAAAKLPLEIAPLATAVNGALDRLEDSMRSRNEFVGNVAHELRTPLATLKLELDAVGDADLRATLAGRVDRVAHVVSQLLELARLEHLAFAPGEAFDLCEATHMAVETALPVLLASGKTIHVDAPPMEIMVRGRERLAELAIANLLDNAARHTPAGTVVSVRVTGKGQVIVADTGPGLAVSDIGRASSRFRRKDHSRSDSAGLGLAIVQRIMLAFGGNVRIENGKQNGTRISLIFKSF